MKSSKFLNNNSFNHIKILGRENTYKLYKSNLKKFKIICEKYAINNLLFDEIIKYLNDSLVNYVNELR